MNILVLTAMQKELQLLKNLLENEKEINVGKDIKIYNGNIGKNNIFLTTCGIGKVNSAINSYRIIMDLNPDFIINSGVAGGVDLPIGSVLAADAIAYHDVWCGPGTEYGQADGYPLFFKPSDEIISKIKSHIKNINYGLICSGDKFISEESQIKDIKKHFPGTKAVDMESASIAQVCNMLKKPLLVIRIVSDTPGNENNISQYKDFWSEAPVKSFNVIKNLISIL